ncbi:hypothetical protein H072_10958 [Dactylellina haptotyla CBS 200.50]|uniref:Uncharacterized protein n=1 Tax=Dactylellina haptotyla (strain CBS 200.50) TaxID=1284197 RepID=S7ZYU0_DACHA|nr:hypothetical protein H072_10958 [Dactylellina haptotyla CBS 200.50]
MQIKAITVAILASSPLAALAANCIGPAGTLGGQCVKFWSGATGCTGTYHGYKPDCSGHCFQFDSFTGIKASGNGLYGTNCAIFSDYDCKNQIASTGNNLREPVCFKKVGKSMKCYFNCPP